MVENFTKSLLIRLAEVARQRLRKRVTDCIGMPDAFAFNDLDVV